MVWCGCGDEKLLDVGGDLEVDRPVLGSWPEAGHPRRSLGVSLGPPERVVLDVNLRRDLSEFNVALREHLKRVETFVIRELERKLGGLDRDSVQVFHECQPCAADLDTLPRKESRKGSGTRVKIEEKLEQVSVHPKLLEVQPPRSPQSTISRGSACDMIPARTSLATGSLDILVGRTKTASQERRENLKKDVTNIIHLTSDSKQSNYLHRMSATIEVVAHITTLLNCVMLGISLDVEPNSMWWWVAYVAFTFVYAVEQILRVRLERRLYWSGPTWRWNLFEAMLVLLAISDLVVSAVMPESTGALSVVTRILRVARLARLARLVEASRQFGPLKEVAEVMRGTLAGMRFLFGAIMLMLVQVYAASIFFRETLGANPHEGDPGGADMFQTVPMSFYTVFSCAIAHECLDEMGRPIFHLVAHHYGWHYVIIFSVLHLFMEFSLFNVIHALFVEQVLSDADQSKKREERDLLSDMGFFAESSAKLLRLLHDAHVVEFHGSVCTDLLSPEDEKWLERAMSMRFPIDMLQSVFNTADAQAVLMDLSIAEEDARCLAKIMDNEGDGKVDVSQLLDTLASIRGSVGRADMIALTFKVDVLLEKIDDLGKKKQEGSTARRQSDLVPSILRL